MRSCRCICNLQTDGLHFKNSKLDDTSRIQRHLKDCPEEGYLWIILLLYKICLHFSAASPIVCDASLLLPETSWRFCRQGESPSMCAFNILQPSSTHEAYLSQTKRPFVSERHIPHPCGVPVTRCAVAAGKLDTL